MPCLPSQRAVQRPAGFRESVNWEGSNIEGILAVRLPIFPIYRENAYLKILISLTLAPGTTIAILKSVTHSGMLEGDVTVGSR